MRDRRRFKLGLTGRVGLFAVAAISVVVLSACASSTPTSSDPAASPGASSAAAATSPAASAGVTEARAAVAAAFKGSFTAPPTTGPKAVRGKTVWTVSVGDSGGAGFITHAQQAAGKILGWTVHSCDGAYDPTKILSCMNQAVAARPDGIFVNSIDCSQIEAPLEAAKAAHIPVVMSFAVDCNQNVPAPDGPALATDTIPSTLYPTVPDYWTGIGTLEAQYLVAETNGDAKVINFVYDSNSGGYLVQKAIQQVFAKECAKCAIYNVPIALTQVDVQDITSLFQSARLRYPDANAFQAFSQTFFELGVDQQLKIRNGLVTVTSGGGDVNTGPELAGGTVDAMVGYDQAWFGYAAADTMNRIFAGQPAVPEGIGLQLLEKGPTAPKAAYAAPVDYPALYKELWTTGS
jgi:ribose transport system substrate-binding protein